LKYRKHLIEKSFIDEGYNIREVGSDFIIMHTKSLESAKKAIDNRHEDLKAIGLDWENRNKYK